MIYKVIHVTLYNFQLVVTHQKLIMSKQYKNKKVWKGVKLENDKTIVIKFCNEP